MSDTLTIAPRREFHTLFDAPLVLDLDTLVDVGAHVGILGLPYGAPYSMEDVTNDQSNAPTAIRRSWQRALRALERWDFDLGGPLLDGKDIRIRDRSGAPDGQEASRMNRALVPRTNEHRHTHGGRFEHGMEAALVESAAHVGDRRQAV